MPNIKGESELTFFEAASIIVGHGVGAGILSVPYLAAHNSFREMIWILLFGYIVALVLHFVIAELSYNNNGAQFISCFDAELFSGVIKKIFTWAAFLLLGLSGQDLGDHQKHTLPYAWAVSVIMVVVGCVACGLLF